MSIGGFPWVSRRFLMDCRKVSHGFLMGTSATKTVDNGKPTFNKRNRHTRTLKPYNDPTILCRICTPCSSTPQLVILQKQKEPTITTSPFDESLTPLESYPKPILRIHIWECVKMGGAPQIMISCLLFSLRIISRVPKRTPI